MLRRAMAASRYTMIVAILGTLVGSLTLILYEAMVLVKGVVTVLQDGSLSSKAVKIFAVALIEAVDVFLIAIAVYIISLGLYSLFVDDTLPLPSWLEVHDLEDLKGNLVSVVIAVLAVLFLREAVAWEVDRDLPAFGAALALVIGALTFFLAKYVGKKQ